MPGRLVKHGSGFVLGVSRDTSEVSDPMDRWIDLMGS